MVQAARIYSRQTEATREKLYLITRANLPAGLRASQFCHVLREFVSDYPETDLEWFRDSNTLVLLEVADEKALEELVIKGVQDGQQCSLFMEADLDNSLTAIAMGPGAKRLLRSLRLAFKEKPEAVAVA